MDSSAIAKTMDLLIIEDEEALARALVRGLRNDWRSITVARDAQEGVTAIDLGRFDVILTDWDCPSGGGQRVVQHSNLPTVIHTANREAQGAFPQTKVVMKPARKEELNNALLAAYLEFEI